MIVTGTTIFWSASLLFVVQPLIARKLLPWFGGSPTVWIVSLLFFQAVLLAGYVYAHLSSRYLDARRQSLLHGVLLVSAFLFLPIDPAQPVDAASSNPTTAILWLLAASLGLPLVILSATNPLLQRWVSRTVTEADGSSVYRLFALSESRLAPRALELSVPARALDHGGVSASRVVGRLCGFRDFRYGLRAPGRAGKCDTYGAGHGRRRPGRG